MPFFKWARPSQVSAPLSINQANLIAPLSNGRAPFYQSGKLERAPLKWAPPSQVGAPLSINQANLSAPLSSERAPSQVGAPLSINQANLSAPFKKGALLPFLQQWVKNLEWMKGWPKRNQLVEAEGRLTHFSSACLLPVQLETPILKRVCSRRQIIISSSPRHPPSPSTTSPSRTPLFPKKETERGYTHFSGACFLHV